MFNYVNNRTKNEKCACIIKNTDKIENNISKEVQHYG